MFDPQIEDLVQQFGLEPHPEGGFYRETYRATGRIPQAVLGEGYHGDRAFGTAILFLLPEGAKSALHRITADEIWHFYTGGPMNLVMLHPDGRVETVVMGNQFAQGQHVQYMVPGGTWFGASPVEGGGYSLVGCTVSPGFDFADFEMGTREGLLAAYPQAQDLIEHMTDISL